MRRMKIECRLAIVAFATAAGCAPLEQAPLVYSSRSQIGVGVTAGTPENPGLDVNIGYKALDAAFVPVAVAKICPKGEKCNAIDPNVKPVQGQNQVTGLSSIDQNEVDAYEATIAEKDRILRDTSVEMAELNRKIADLDTLDSKRQELAALNAREQGESPAVLSAEEERRRTELRAKIDQIAAYGPVADLRSRLDQVTRMSEAAAAEKLRAADLRDRLIARKRLETGDAKLDAYSVYGTFNGSANGTKDGASLTAGKVFSTGIAAQNLSQGVREGTRASAATACLVAARELLNAQTLTPEQKKARSDRLLLLCGVNLESGGS